MVHCFKNEFPFFSGASNTVFSILPFKRPFFPRKKCIMKPTALSYGKNKMKFFLPISVTELEPSINDSRWVVINPGWQIQMAQTFLSAQNICDINIIEFRIKIIANLLHMF